MDGRCETCKWWHKRFGQCLLLSETPSRTGVPDALWWAAADRRNHRRNRATSQGEGQGSEGSVLETEPDFGCVQWEAKVDGE